MLRKEKKQKEIWKTYPDYDFIEVSNFGNVRTKDRYVSSKNGSKRLVKSRVLKQRDNRHSYMQVDFRVNGKTVHLSVHRMVAITYIPNPNNYPEVNHIDNNPKNNATSNLEWCSRKYNEAYKKNFGTSQVELFGCPTIAVSQETSEVFWFESQSEASRQLGVDQGHISMVINGKLNKTGGYWFCYADENAVEKTRVKFGDEIARKVEELMKKINK